MKNFFLKTGLTLLCLLIGLGSAWGEDYELITAAPTDWSGSYLIAYVNGTTAYVYNGTDSGANNGVSATISSNKISSASGMAVIEIASISGGYSLKVVGGTNNGKYISGGTSNGTTFNSSAVANSITLNSDGTVKINNNTSTSFQFNSASDQQRFRYFKSAQKGVKLFKKVESATPKTFTVTFSAGTDGACSTSSLTEASAGAGVTLPSCTANTNYTFVGWSTSSTPSSADAGTAGENYKPSADCTLYAYYTYQAPTHTAHFSVNGTINNTNDCTVAEGAAITFPTAPTEISGKKFVGWTTSAISGMTNTAPATVTSATMGNNDITYYAVYATQGTGGGSPGYQNVTSLTVGKTYVFGSVNAAASSNLAANTEIGAVAFNNTYNSTSPNWGTAIKVTPNEDGFIASSSYKYSSEEALTRWTLEAIDNGNYKFKNGSNYIFLGDKTGSTSNGAQAGISSTGNVYIENVNSTCANAFLLHPSSTSTNIMLWNTSNGYRMYAFRSYTAAMTPYVRFYEYTDGTSYSGYCTTIGSETPTITAESTLSLPASESDGTFNVTWTNVEEYDATLYADDACTSKIEDCDWLIIELTSSKNIDYYASANMSTSPRTVYMQLYGVAADGTTDATKVVTITQAGKQASDPTISNFIKTSSIELTVGADPYDVRQCLNIPSDYDTSTYAITTTIDGITQKDNEYACVYPYLSFQKAGTYTVHVVAAAMPGKYAQTEGDITVNVTAPAAPITTIPDLFTKATEVGGTETDINITFNNWVVSGATTSNAYVTDGTNGFIIYQSGHGFTAGNVLNGTVACKVLLYNGAAEIKGLTSSSAGLTVTTDGTITPRTTTIDALENVNVGSVITLEGVSYDAPNLTDGENTIQPFTSLYNYPNTTFTQGTRYNVTGVYILYKSDNNLIKEILPRSAEDIQEIEAEKYDIIITPSSNGTITASLEEAAAGVEVTLTVTPDSGYQLSNLTVTNASTSEAITVTGNKFIMPAANVNVTATFEESTPSDIIFYESFDTNKGTGGNDGAWSGSIASSDLQFDNTGWDCTSGNGADRCAKFGSGKAQGSATTPALNYAGDATLTFKAGAWNGSTEGTTLNISIEGGGSASPTSVTLTKGAWDEYTITLTGLTTTSKIKFVAKNTSNNRFFLDEVTVTKSSITPATEYDITIASDIENGTISASKAKAEEGDNITITTTPTTGYHLASLYYTEEGDATTQHPITATNDVYSFTMPATNVTVSATFAEDVKYTVTIETPENGTLVVMHGDDVVKTGDKFAEGEKLNITATPAEGYKFRNWQAVDGTTHTFTSGTTWTMSASDVTIKANFDLADQKYLISWNVNGTVTNQQVNAGSALEAPTMTGKTLGTREFAGWTEDALVKNDTIPTYVTLGTATKDVTYYAVFADREEVTAAVPTSITAYADGNYYLVDKYVVEGVSHYYALDGNINQNNFIIPTDITAAVTENPDGSITINESNPIIKDAMKYSMSLTVEGNDSTIVLRNLLTNKVINKVTGSSNANNLTNNEDAASWTHFYAMPHRDADDKKSLPEQIADPNRFTLSTSTSDNWESHAIFMQYSSWNSTYQVQDVSPRVKAYAVGNRGIQPPKAQMHSAGYLYFVPATPIALSNFATHEVSVSQYGSTTLCMPQDYVMPEGLTGKIVTANEAVDSKGDGYYTLTFQTKYTAGDIVPAGECLVLSGNQGSYYIAPGETTAKVSDDNLLHGDYAIDTTDSKLRFITIYDEENASSNFYYKLATDKNKENFGWYWGNTTGEPFIMTSNERAYLVIDKGTAGLIRGFALDEFGEEDITTFIEGLTNDEINKSGRIYNLQGQMVNKLQKGINIVNGKKVIR